MTWQNGLQLTLTSLDGLMAFGRSWAIAIIGKIVEADRLWEQHPSQYVVMTHGEESSAKMKINFSNDEGSPPKLTEAIMPQNQLAFRTIG